MTVSHISPDTGYGPCVICGDTNYDLSCGGPTICPKCDCGNFDAATVLKQAKVIEGLRAQLASVAQTPPIVSMISDDELAELVDVHLALDRLSAPRQSEGFDLSAARRVNLLVHEMEKAASDESPQEKAE